MTRSIRILITLFVAAIAAVAMPGRGFSQVVYTDPYENYNEETFFDMDFEPNLATPIVPDSEKGFIRRHMLETAKKIKGPFTVDLMRDGEVIVVTIAAEVLFPPNDSILGDAAERAFKPLLPLMEDALKYKVVYAVHTDDTGNEIYQDEFSAQRMNSIYDYLLELIDDELINPDIVIVPYAMGALDPIVDNNTWRNRAINRRVEFYFIPGPDLIEEAHRSDKAAAAVKK